MSGKPLIEVIAVNAADARAAEAGGADRIELVCAMSEGGLTPSFGMIEQVASSVSIPVYVMIRTHSRSFCYNEDDIEAMKKDIRAAREQGASGIVIGGLTNDCEADLAMLQKCLAEAERLGVTFHRAIDESASLTRTLDAISQFSQIERVLTSGGKSSALEAADELKQLSERGKAQSIAIMAGAGLKVDRIRDFVLRTGITELHFGSGVRREGSFHLPVDSNLVARAKQCLIDAAKERYNF